MTVMNLQPGAMVMALKDLDPEGAKVDKGDFGVVFQAAVMREVNPSEGPLVRWIRTQEDCPRGCKYHKCLGMSEHGDFGTKDGWDHVMGGVCNVYDGDVVEVKSE